jgi:hypothetical protein
MEGSRVDHFAHAEVPVTCIECVEDNAQSKDRGYETPVGHGIWQNVEA